MDAGGVNYQSGYRTLVGYPIVRKYSCGEDLGLKGMVEVW